MRFTGQPAAEVTAAEISRNFGMWQDRAQSGPVIVTHHGRPRTVLVSAESFGKAVGEAPDSASLDDVGRAEASLAAILRHSQEGFIAFDKSLRIVGTNPTFESLTVSWAAHLVGKTLDEAFPGGNAVFGEYLRRTLLTGESADFEIASTLIEGRTYRVRTFAFPGGVGALLVSRTEDREHERRQEAYDSLRLALLALPDIATASLNLRGVFAGVDPAFSVLTGFELADLAGVRLGHLIKPASRHLAAEAVEHCLAGAGAQRLDTSILTKGSSETPVRIALAPLIRNGVPDGVTLAMIPA